MKSRDTAMRVMRKEIQDTTRKVEDLERIIREFEAMASDLERQIQLEEDRTGIRDPNHVSYSTFANAAAQRRDKLRNSMQGLNNQLEVALKEREETSEKFAKASAQSQSPNASAPGGSALARPGRSFSAPMR